MEEKFLYHIWDEGHLIGELKSLCGKSIKVLHPGIFNTGRGADFKNAIIEIDGETYYGDVEIHLKSQDWQAHGHQEDIYYNSVILHVVLSHKSAYQSTILEDGSLVPILELMPFLSDDISKLLESYAPPSQRNVYCDLLSALPHDNLQLILVSAGLRRFKSKIKRFNAMLSLSSFDQLFYEGLFEALGYSKNKLNTLQLAQSLPLKQLKEYKQQGLSASELASIYLCASGVLKLESAILDKEISQKIWELYELQPYYAQKLHIDWQFFRIRPQNHPIKRLIYISQMIWENLDGSLLQYFLGPLQAVQKDAKAHYKEYRKLWHTYELFSGLQLSAGKSVLDNVYLNILLPVNALWLQKTSGDATELFELYSAFPGLSENHLTRFMSRYLSEKQAALVNSKAIYQQGLLDIYHRYCSWHLCAECIAQNRG